MSIPEPVPLLQTKLQPPRVAHGPILRLQLFELLDAGKDNVLTLVSAPPGYGKSVLLTTWLAERKPSFGWISLDTSDNSPEVFLQYLIAAIQQQHPKSCCEIESSISNTQALNFSYLANYLTEEIAASKKPTLLILDDFHYIRNKEIHDFIADLIQTPPPNLRLIILTRRDPPLPLNTLRSQGWLTEIRMQDLEFKIEEAADFLEPFAGDPLSKQTLQNLDKQLEGWAAGLRLVSLNLRYCKDANRFLSELKGSPQAVREYLMSEVLAQQPEMFNNCLLKVSVLDRFCAPLCKDLCISTDPDLEAQCKKMHEGEEFPLMANLLESNLFMIALDVEGIWYRFHHLFQDFLRERLKTESGEELVAVLHSQASEWFASQDLLEEAVGYSLKGTNPSAAAKLVVKHRHRLTQTEQDARLNHLINLLPTEQVETEPVLLLHQAWALLELLKLEGDTVLNRAESLIKEMPPDDPDARHLMGEVHAIRSIQYSGAANPAESRRQAESALNLLDEDQWMQCGIARIMQIFSRQMEGKMNEARALVFKAFEDTRIQNTAFHTRLLGVLCFMYWVEADLDAMFPVVRELRNLGRKLGFPHAIAHALYLEGTLHYERNEPDKAEDPLTEVLEKYQEANLQNWAHATFALALTYQAQNRPDEARGLGEQVIRRALELQNALLLELAEAFMADLNLRQGKLADASLWAKSFNSDPHQASARFFVPHLTFAKILMAEGNPQSQKTAFQILTQLEEVFIQCHNNRVLIHVLVLKALCQQKSKDLDAALISLARAIKLAQPGRITRPFIGASPDLIPLLNRLDIDAEGIEYVGHILSGFTGLESHRPKKSSAETKIPSGAGVAIDDPLVDPLTDRELEVLNLLSARLSNQEIGERLFIAPGTVKRHTNTIYNKLNVHSRRDAVAKARGLGFLES